MSSPSSVPTGAQIGRSADYAPSASESPVRFPRGPRSTVCRSGMAHRAAAAAAAARQRRRCGSVCSWIGLSCFILWTRTSYQQNVVLEGPGVQLPNYLPSAEVSRARKLPPVPRPQPKPAVSSAGRQSHACEVYRQTNRRGSSRSFVGSGKEGEPSDEPEVLGRQWRPACLPSCQSLG